MPAAPFTLPTGTWKLQLMFPLASEVHWPGATFFEVPPYENVNEMLPFAAKPKPVAVTLVPSTPILGFKMNVGTTVTFAERLCVPSLAVMTWLPAGIAGIGKLQEKLPSESVEHEMTIP